MSSAQEGALDTEAGQVVVDESPAPVTGQVIAGQPLRPPAVMPPHYLDIAGRMRVTIQDQVSVRPRADE